MNTLQSSRAEASRYELRFESLFKEGRGYAFPCDADGRVDIDTLGHTLRLNYLFVRTLIGRDFAMPAVRPATVH